MDMCTKLVYRSVVVAALLAMPARSMPQATTDPNKIDVVAIDAGHGGKDPGNLGTGRYRTTEKDVALNVSLLVGKYIEQAFPDVKVIYTRDDDRFVELNERCRIANNNKADVFISIHCNANNSSAPAGCETYVMGLHKTQANMQVAQKENAAILLEEGHELKYDGYDPKDPESLIALSLRQNAYLDHSLLLSALVQEQFKDRVGRHDRGVKQAGFLVISYTTMPAVLIELGFLTNGTEEDFLQSAQGQDYMASAIYRAFKEYKAEVEGIDVAQGPGGGGPAADTIHEEGRPRMPLPEPGVRFKVQVVTASKHIETAPKNFNGLQGVEEHRGSGLFKYTVGDEPTLDAARALQQECRDRGYDGAFIVAYRNGERIELQEAVKLAQGQ